MCARFDVVCGGPETVALMGWHAAPLWRGDAVYLPAYPPLYDRSGPLLDAVRDVSERRPGLWVPLALHLPWEADDGWEDLERLAPKLARYAAPWGDFLTAVTASRGDPSP